MTIPARIAALAGASLILAAISLRADQLQMQNGDRYTGKILSMSSNSVVLESDTLGQITLPRNKISLVMFGSAAATNTAPVAPIVTAPLPTAAATNADLSAALHNLGANTNFIQQIRQQMLTGADPAANQKYDELVGGLMSGKMNLSDLRNEAKASIDQINQLKRELGPQADDSLDSYLSILQNFVNDTASTPAPAAIHSGTNSPAVPRE
ncbi:MAG TPA: hypothetical protein VH597_05935 [Verrucomicrobiae bacterium]|jgi:hypothetical protein|nr:hypothetical protein [Verrucomicrobiae bacterium]